MKPAVAIQRLGAEFGDWDAMLDLIRRAFAYMDDVIDPPSSAHQLTPATLADKARVEAVYIAAVDGRMAGCMCLADRGDHLYLGKLAIEPSAQGLGIGRHLLDAADRHARQLGRREIELQVRIELSRNQAFFMSNGYRETERTSHAGYSRITSITFRKPVP